MTRERFRDELRSLINRHSLENESDTPDFILADFLDNVLDSLELAVNAREKWYAETRTKALIDARLVARAAAFRECVAHCYKYPYQHGNVIAEELRKLV